MSFYQHFKGPRTPVISHEGTWQEPVCFEAGRTTTAYWAYPLCREMSYNTTYALSSDFTCTDIQTTTTTYAADTAYVCVDTPKQPE
jgi:hypothetical protein